MDILRIPALYSSALTILGCSDQLVTQCNNYTTMQHDNEMFSWKNILCFSFSNTMHPIEAAMNMINNHSKSEINRFGFMRFSLV